MSYKISEDIGNSSIKIIVNGELYLKIPNVVSFDKPNYFVETQLADSTEKALGRNRLDVNVTLYRGSNISREVSFMLGTMAESKSDKENRKSSAKSKDEQLIANALTGIAYAIIRYKVENKEKLSKNLTAKVDLSTGLPFGEWKIPGNADMFSKKLKGNHLIEFNNPYFKNKLGVESIELVIENVICKAEGISTLNYIIYNENSEISAMDDFELIGKIFTIADLGALTSELVSFQFSIDEEEEDEDDEIAEPVAGIIGALSKGIPEGIGHVMDRTIEEVEKTFNVDKLIRRDIEKIFVGKNYGYLKGTDINVLPIFNKYAEQFAYRLSRELIGVYNDGNVKNKVKRIYITGGGSASDAIVNKIKEVFQQDGYDPNIIMVITNPDPVFANAIGYYTELVDAIEEEI